MSADWKSDSKKFGLPANRGDVALVCITVQRAVAVIDTLTAFMPSQAADSMTKARKILADLDERLEQMQIRLVGKEGDDE